MPDTSTLCDAEVANIVVRDNTTVSLRFYAIYNALLLLTLVVISVASIGDFLDTWIDQ